MIAVSVLASWALIGLAVAGVILFYKVLNLSAEAAAQWWNAAHGQGEDLPANQERER